MKLMIAAVLVFFCSLAGAFGASLLRPAPSSPPGAENPMDGSEARPTAEKPSMEATLSESYESSDSMYFKFSREFVVPIMRQGDVESLVIINMSIEADPGVSDTLFRMEPKLRDNIMTTLIELSHETDSLQNFADVQNYETLRSAVLYGLQELVPEGIRNILIVDIGRQNL